MGRGIRFSTAAAAVLLRNNQVKGVRNMCTLLFKRIDLHFYYGPPRTTTTDPLLEGDCHRCCLYAYEKSHIRLSHVLIVYDIK